MNLHLNAEPSQKETTNHELEDEICHQSARDHDEVNLPTFTRGTSDLHLADSVIWTSAVLSNQISVGTSIDDLRDGGGP